MYRNKPKAFDEIEIGDEAEFTVKISEEMHEAFSEIVGDFSPIHTDSKFVSGTRYENKIGFGFLLEGFLSRLYGEYLPGGSSICIKQEAKFIKPYYVGDEIRIKGRVTKKIESTKFVEIYTEMYRQKDECIFKGNGLVQVLYSSEMINPLFEAKDGYVYYNDFVNALNKLGIKKGDTIFVHSDITVFGKLALKDRNKLLKTLVDILKECVGEAGTIIMPTFTYSFCKGEDFDVEKSKSTVGILTEYFRNMPDVDRTVQPIFSCAVCGKDKEKYLDIGKDSFGTKSIFDILHKNNGKLLFFGADFHACTYIHHLEQSFKVPYRYLKTFKGTIRNGDDKYEDEVTFYVRDLKTNPVLDVSLLKKYMIQNGYMKETQIGYGKVILIDAADLYEEGKKLLNEDINYFLKK